MRENQVACPRKSPISGLQHWPYCPRQRALIDLEQAWVENKFTADGRVMHENGKGAGNRRIDHYL